MIDRLILVLVVSVCVAVIWGIRHEIVDVLETHVAFLDEDGLVEVPLPSGWASADVWEALAEIEALPEVVHA